ncbi:MAG: UDP-N-acetylmuramoyl-tripeptide--D-alanyl-D-alanine ligase [Ardenticatenaceae bacterium]|nr:UDP-N-acetylmuramoyl-tripeptide--D-alanyl-D-alanine ligase [Ardenticatenaceae bacterium]
MLTLAHFFQVLAGVTLGGETAVTNVITDSRDAQPGSLFVALPGEKVDGHEYVAQAFEGGAVAALVERPPLQSEVANYHTLDLRQPDALTEVLTIPTPVCLVVDDTLAALQAAAQAWREQFNTRIIGITGSVGKTSTKELVYSVLSQRYRTLKSPGNKNSIIGLPPVLLDLRPEHERAVLEMSMYVPGEIARLCELAPPSVGVVTIIGPVHLERAGSMEAIVAAKQELIEALPAEGVAILNKDDKRVMSMANHTDARIFTYGLDPTADLWADEIHSMGLDGMRFTLHHATETLRVQVPLIGRHSVHTALRAAAVGLVEGLAWDEIIAGLQTQSAAQLRMVAAPGPHGSIIIDDTYNASPDSTMAALNLLADLNGRHVAVLGDMLELGYMEEAGHRLVGRRAADVAQILVAVGQRGYWIGEEALKVGMNPQNVFLAEDTETATKFLEELIEANDVVLIKGSLGMRMDRIVTAIGTDGDKL